jgi:bisphosphoglycerate-dependent phosphoglycerate mutase
MIEYTCIDYNYIDLDGNLVKRNKEKYPYGYDPFVIWRGDYKEGKNDVVYSDRMYQWDHKKYEGCIKAIWTDCRQHFSDSNPKDIESFLSLYFDKKIKLTAIMEGCNVSNGYPYWIFFFED